MATKHTLGPWTIHPHENAGGHPNHQYRFVGTADFDEDRGRGEIIAKLTDSPAIIANAKLIAAAPDLLAALQRAMAVIDALMPGLKHIAVRDYQEINEAPVAARAAIARATA